MSAKRILIVEDNEELAFGLRRTLESEGYAVEVAPDGETGITAVRRHKHDLIILDLMLPDLDGFRVLKTLRDRGTDAPVLILSAKGEETDKVYGFRLGADDYVTKPFGLSELIARVAALLRRGAPQAESEPSILTFGSVEVNVTAHAVTKAGEPVALTPKEFDLLVAFLRRPGAVLTRATLLREVWTHSPDVLTRTVDIHVGELRRKLEDNPSAPRYFATVWKTGYRFDP